MRAIDEVVSIVHAVGQALSAPFLTEAYRLLTLEGSPQTSSMYRDLIAGRGIEADQIIGDLLQRATAKGLEAPILALVYTNLCVASFIGGDSLKYICLYLPGE